MERRVAAYLLEFNSNFGSFMVSGISRREEVYQIKKVVMLDSQA